MCKQLRNARYVSCLRKKAGKTVTKETSRAIRDAASLLLKDLWDSDSNLRAVDEGSGYRRNREAVSPGRGVGRPAAPASSTTSAAT